MSKTRPCIGSAMPGFRACGITAVVIIVVVLAFSSFLWRHLSIAEIELITATISLTTTLIGLLVALAPRRRPHNS